MVYAFGSLWIPTCGDGALQRIDPQPSKITATIKSGAADIHGSIVASADSIWLLTDTRETLSRIDPDQNAVVGEIRAARGMQQPHLRRNLPLDGLPRTEQDSEHQPHHQRCR